MKFQMTKRGVRVVLGGPGLTAGVVTIEGERVEIAAVGKLFTKRGQECRYGYLAAEAAAEWRPAAPGEVDYEGRRVIGEMTLAPAHVEDVANHARELITLRKELDAVKADMAYVLAFFDAKGVDLRAAAVAHAAE